MQKYFIKRMLLLVLNIYAYTVNAQTKTDFITGIQRPEDLVNIPGTDWIIISSMAMSAGETGRLLAVSTAAGNMSPRVLYPADTSSGEKIFPHGISLLKIDSTHYRLYVINHGEKETIEVFTIAITGDGPAASRSNSIATPPGIYANGIVALKDGSIFVTSMYTLSTDFLPLFTAGTPTGQFWKWHPQNGWSADKQALCGANGIAVSPDNQFLFVAEWAVKKIWRIPLNGHGKRTSVSFDFLPDNLRWTDKGSLLITGQKATPENVFRCITDDAGRPVRYCTAELYPATLQYRVIIQGGDKTFDGGTVAIRLKNNYYIGSALVNSIACYHF